MYVLTFRIVRIGHPPYSANIHTARTQPRSPQSVTAPNTVSLDAVNAKT
jgi:hypothetical protein